ncbi:sensor histidine kinase [Gracilibacillus salinarum]|uniref:histidine kinase n=1 Tax=Gracilibacillus salinarum TaxID=2932255 RepID=A0ABY4GK71_9BACI|nr:sensor histidine kinase [Gracilibacillus salinarum]UOQ84761.1 sensor histidine kinase [Gracilibacillus salinarum]
MKKRNLGIFIKFTFAFITVGIIPLMILSYLSISTVSNQVERHTINNYEEILDYSSTRVADIYETYNYITKLMYTYNLPEFGRVHDVINKQDQMSSYRTERAIDDFLRTLLNTDQYIKNVTLVPTFDRVPRYHSRNANQFIQENYTLYEDHQDELEGNYNQLTILPVHQDDYFANTKGYVITFARNLLDSRNIITENSDIQGTIFIDIDLAVFEEIFNDLNFEPSDQVYVLDEENQIIYSSKTELIGKEMSGVVNEISDNHFQLTEDVDELGWKVVAEMERQSLFDRLSGTLKVIHIVIIGAMLALIIVALFFSRRFAQPISQMTKLMKKVESGKLDDRLTMKRKDEIGQLADGLDHMLDSLNQYISKVYIAQINQKQAELNALRSQIQPHYLYNTLEVIRMSAVDQDADEVAEMIHYLSTQLKYIMEHNDDVVPLEKELKYVEAYLNLIAYRYEDRIRYQINKDDAVSSLQSLPKLTIQPIVENAIMHGLKEKNGNGTIEVAIEKKDQCCVISVLDDGVGMDHDAVNSLNSYLYNKQVTIDKKNNGIGLKNIHQRIFELYGNPFGIEIESNKYIGTQVRIILPIQEVQ